MTMRKKVFLLFIGVLAVKIFLTINVLGPELYPDEACEILQAQYLGQNLEYANCEKASTLPADGIMPLYLILISPIYWFLKGQSAYHAVLMFNALLGASVVVPLANIFKRFFKKDYIVILSTLFIAFIPEIQAHETIVKPDLLFLVLNIWFLDIYFKSKLAAFFVAVLASLSRPFGFITLLAFGINEFAVAKNKKIPIFLIIFGLIVTYMIIITLLPDLPQAIIQKIQSAADHENLQRLIIATKNQINSFTLSTYLIPILIFANNVGKLGKIKWFVISFIALNFIISTQHMYGYYLEGKQLDILTRYINTPVSFIMIFATIFIQKEKLRSFRKPALVLALLLLSLVFFKHNNANVSVNISTQGYYDISNYGAFSGFFLSKLFLLTIAALLVLFFMKKRQILMISIAVLILGSSGATMKETYARSAFEYNSPDWKFFQNSEYKVLFMLQGEINARTFMKLLMFTKNKLDLRSFDANLRDYDILITTMPEELLESDPPIKNYKIGETMMFESIYDLRLQRLQLGKSQ